MILSVKIRSDGHEVARLFMHVAGHEIGDKSKPARFRAPQTFSKSIFIRHFQSNDIFWMFLMWCLSWRWNKVRREFRCLRSDVFVDRFV